MNSVNHPRRIYFILVMALYGAGILLAPTWWMLTAVLMIWLLVLKTRTLHWIKALVLLPLIFAVMMESALLSHMIRHAARETIPTGSETMIIPGAAVVGDEPGAFLRARLDTALIYLDRYPDMKVIVTGGRSPEDALGESQVMKQYLKDRGIAPDRIMEERRSTDTIRNLEYAAEVISARGLSREVLIVTHEFHAFRAHHIAQTIGLMPLTADVRTTDRHLIRYLVREIASLVKVQLHYGLRLR